MTAVLSAEPIGDVLLVRVAGPRDLTAEDAAQFDAAAAELPVTGVVVLDLSDVGTMEGAAIGALVRWQRHLAEHGSQLRLAAPGRQLKIVLQLLRLHRLFEIYDRVEDAVSGDELEAP